MTRQNTSFTTSIGGREYSVLIDISEQSRDITIYAQDVLRQGLVEAPEGQSGITLQISDSEDYERAIGSLLKRCFEILKEEMSGIEAVNLWLENCELDFVPFDDDPSSLQDLPITAIHAKNCWITPESFNQFVNISSAPDKNISSSLKRFSYQHLAFKDGDNKSALDDRFLESLQTLISGTSLLEIDGKFELVDAFDEEHKVLPEFSTRAISAFSRVVETSNLKKCNLGDDFADQNVAVVLSNRGGMQNGQEQISK